MTPIELLERLAAIVPRPRVHLTRFAGVFAPHFKFRSMVVPKPKEPPPEAEAPAAKSRISWARLLKRVNIDVETCPMCAGLMKIIAAIEDPPVIKKILEHLGLPTKPPVPWPARGPPPSLEHDTQQFPDFDQL
jgi:Putative transposase